jgi:tRNA pseudouridine-54 N-methylase
MTEHGIFSDDERQYQRYRVQHIVSVAALLLTASRVVAIVSEEIEYQRTSR